TDTVRFRAIAEHQAVPQSGQGDAAHVVHVGGRLPTGGRARLRRKNESLASARTRAKTNVVLHFFRGGRGLWAVETSQRYCQWHGCDDDRGSRHQRAKLIDLCECENRFGLLEWLGRRATRDLQFLVLRGVAAMDLEQEVIEL